MHARAQPRRPQVPELVHHLVDQLRLLLGVQREVDPPEHALERAVAERAGQQRVATLPGLFSSLMSIAARPRAPGTGS